MGYGADRKVSQGLELMAKMKEQKIGRTSKTHCAYDPLISKLFDSSVSILPRRKLYLQLLAYNFYQLGPAKPISTPQNRKPPSDEFSRSLDDTIRSLSSAIEEDEALDPTTSSPIRTSVTQPLITPGVTAQPQRRWKRGRDEDDIEGKYMQRLNAEESKTVAVEEAEHMNKRQKFGTASMGEDENTSPASTPSEDDGSDAERSGSPGVEVPQHESLELTRDQLELEKSTRTVFLANVSTSAIKSKTAKKALLDHLVSFSHSLSSSDKPHKVKSIRFRSTPFVSGVGPKKAAFAKKELMDTTAKSTNAYVVYTTSIAAREAVKQLNGTTVLDRHLLVDSVAHPRKTDHRRCVFVGNLGFVDDDSQINAAKAEQGDQKPRKKREPSDIEEGLWRQFGKAGSVESVRVVRDANTRVGKGFAYVQFEVSLLNWRKLNA